MGCNKELPTKKGPTKKRPVFGEKVNHPAATDATLQSRLGKGKKYLCGGV